MKFLLNLLWKEMRPARYSLLVLAGAVFFGAGFAAVNYMANDFGLWRPRETIRLWGLEKTSKYLLAHRHVPEHFDAIMIGSSVSANLDTRRIEGYRVYNFSMSGGNITETGAAAEKYLQAPGDHKLMIVTLHPYMIKNSGMKSFQIHEKEYYGSLFSLIPAVIWVRKLQDRLGLMHDAFDESEAGWNNFNFPSTAQDMDKMFAQQTRDLADLENKPVEHYQMDAQAIEELRRLLDLARAKGVRIAAYYYPIFGPRHDAMRLNGEWALYTAAMEPLFQPGEIIADMNTPAFDVIRRDPKAYHDTVHLSQMGANLLLERLNLALDATIGHDRPQH